MTHSNITLEDSRRFRVTMKINIFKKLGVGWKRVAPNAYLASDRPAFSKLNPIVLN